LIPRCEDGNHPLKSLLVLIEQLRIQAGKARVPLRECSQ
jgi:hypothetical protein